MNDMSGDGVAGGAFMAGFTVVNYGNVVYARPDYVENPLVPSTLSERQLWPTPIPVLAPEGNPQQPRWHANPNAHNPNGGLNSHVLLSAGQLQHRPTTSAATASSSSRRCTRPQQLSYVLGDVSARRSGHRGGRAGHSAAQSGHRGDHAGDLRASGSGGQQRRRDQRQCLGAVQHDPGVRRRARLSSSQNAALYRPKPGQCASRPMGPPAIRSTSRRTTTPRIGGATNNNPDTNPFAGDWGGIVFRNYDEAALSQQVSFPVDGIAGRPERRPRHLGRRRRMSILNNANIRYAGGAVPQGSSNFFSAVTLYNSRPAITNTT